MPTCKLPGDPSLEHLKNQARTLQRHVRAADPQAIATVREFHPRLREADRGDLAGFPLAAAQLVIARQYGFASWAKLRRHAEVVISPVASPAELACAFELIGARRAPTLEQDRYFLQVARRFPDDRPLMLVAEHHRQVIGAGFAFRRDSTPSCRSATLRDVAVRSAYAGLGLERRLIENIEQGAVSLGVAEIFLGGPRGPEREFFLSMGYHGRHEGGLLGKSLSASWQRNPGWRQDLDRLRSQRQDRLGTTEGWH